MRKLFFKLYSAGLNNCRISLEIGVGLAHLTGCTLVPYCVAKAWSSDPLLRRGVDYSNSATVLDLFEIPVPFESSYARRPVLKMPSAIRLFPAPVWDSVLRLDSPAPLANRSLRAFRNGRDNVFRLSSKAVGDPDLIVDVDTLSMYSCFFFGPPSVQSELRRVIRQLRPKLPYRQFAGRLASTLGRFNSIHIRRGDFRYVGQSPRAHEVTAKEVIGNLASRFSQDDLLVICTDTSGEDWFTPFRQYFRRTVFLDQLILSSRRWRAEFQALPYHDDAALGLVTQLVAVQSNCFVGTLFSSFTAVIQRLRGFAGKPEFLFCYSDWDPNLVRYERCEFLPVQDGPYSWNRVLYPVFPNVFCWFREWPEAIHPAPEGEDQSDRAGGVVLLRADAARVHGRSARYERLDDWNDNIGYWTDHRDFVSWSFIIAEHPALHIEARYACPDECAGSTYTVEIGSDTVFTGQVRATGDWALFSSWQRLTTITLARGTYTLTVRIAKLAGYAAMNLAGIRLVPSHE
jgi:hypothetical protein